ncbi:MAG: TonB-dependent receptor [Pseudomonadota bacterium]
MQKPSFTRTPVAAGIAIALGVSVAPTASAQEVIEEVVVTGIRGSLQRSLDVKRGASGVVDAISAEDIGKMPDTNLAESLQRITGVSINRVNGEGSEVTVRGFGPNFNLVTVNGRQMPSANVTSVTGNPTDQGNQGVTRSFDFQNLASEGVSGIQIYKTGRASEPTGGIGATVNIQTIRPLTAGEQLSVGLKAVDDQTGDDITPEISGLYSYVNDDSTFGVSVFGSYQERNSGSRHMSIENWFPGVWNDDTQFGWGMANSNIINEPADGTVVARPSNIGIGFNEDERERTNGQITLQFAPSDDLTITADAFYAENVQNSVALIDGLWHQATNYTNVEFDGNPRAASPVRLEEVIDGGPTNPFGAADFFFQNLTLGVEETLESFGLNFDWQMRDDLNVKFDVATSSAESGPDGPFGLNSLRFNIAGAAAGWRAWDYTLPIPQVSVVVDEQRTSDPNGANGILDVADIGTQVTQEYFSEQMTDTDQFRIDATWDVKEDVQVQFGAGYLGTEMEQNFEQGQLALGGWGADVPGDIPAGLISQTCSGCQFDANLSNTTPAAGNALPTGAQAIPLGSVSFIGNSVALSEGLASTYNYTPGNIPLVSTADNLVEEEIVSAYVQADFDGELAGFSTHLTVGARYEYTEVTSTTNQSIPQAIIWLSDNDFQQQSSAESLSIKDSASYNNFLPSLDLTVDLSDTLVGRVSLSQTLARPTYDKYFQSTTVQNPPRPTFLGGEAGGSRGNVGLDPLESNNVDISLEWYYGDQSLLSLGYYRKDVQNFVGTEIVDQPLFDLRDATSGAPGSRSGDAAAALEQLGFPVTERNLFTMTAILDNPTDFPGGAAEYENSQTFADAVFSQYDVIPNAADPLFIFGVQQPLNTQTATIYGFEFVTQHWFGDTGLGYSLNYTTVEGDIEYDIGGDPSVDQFALQGLSDSANLALMYENYGFSARLVYNWRDDFLNQAQRAASGANRMPEFIDEYEQVDLALSYLATDNLSFTLDVINLTEEEIIHYGRTRSQLFFYQETEARYMLGVRWTMN